MNTKPHEPTLADVVGNLFGPDPVEKAISELKRLDRETLIIRIDQILRYNHRVEMGLVRLKIAIQRGEI